MARNASNLFSPPAPSKTAPATTLTGYVAFNRPPKEQLMQTLLTNTFGNTFYQTKEELVAETERVHSEAIKLDVNFYAKALAYARNSGFMRTQPVYGLALLSAVKEAGVVFEETFPKVIKTPNDLVDFASIINSLGRGEGGRRIKRVAGNWLRNNLSEYWAIKYGSEKKTYALRDLFRTYHPKGEKSALVDYVLGHEGADLSGLTQIAAFEALKKATTTAEKIAAIKAGKLPHEVATSFAGTDKKVWEAIIPNMPIFALLRNLATLERHGVLDAAKDRIVKLFSDPEVVRNSKVFPFRFLEASKHVTKGWAQDACRVALELSLNDGFGLQGETAVALDVSGSMSSYIEMAAIFGIATMKRTDGNSKFLAFNDAVYHIPVSRIDSVLTQASKINVSGGTYTAAVPQAMLNARDKFDNLVLITDEQQNQGSPFMDKIAEYRRKVSPNCKVFVLNVAPYSSSGSLLNSNDAKNFYVYGQTEASMNYIAMATTGYGKFVQHVENGEN